MLEQKASFRNGSASLMRTIHSAGLEGCGLIPLKKLRSKEQCALKRRKEVFMAKYLDKTPEQWDKLVEQWHTDASIECSLQEFLELDDIEYMKYTLGISDEELSDEDVLKKSSDIARCVVTEAVIKPRLAACRDLFD